MKTLLTREEKNKWLVRLRDPNSIQLRGQFVPVGAIKLDDTNLPMCCLAHACFAVNGIAKSLETFNIIGKLPEGIANKLIFMNDKDRQSLPEIADWVEENLETVD